MATASPIASHHGTPTRRSFVRSFVDTHGHGMTDGSPPSLVQARLHPASSLAADGRDRRRRTPIWANHKCVLLARRAANPSNPTASPRPVPNQTAKAGRDLNLHGGVFADYAASPLRCPATHADALARPGSVSPLHPPSLSLSLRAPPLSCLLLLLLLLPSSLSLLSPVTLRRCLRALSHSLSPR